MLDQRFLDQFRQTVDSAAARLLTVSDVDASRRPPPGKWSRKEIIGHLIDSAAHNHVRFVRAQLQDDFVFTGYDQDAFVRAQRYQDRPWADLVRLWQLHNHHIASVMATADPQAIDKPRLPHNLDRIAWKPVPTGEPTTLDYFMRDYVGHLEHHLRQTT